MQLSAGGVFSGIGLLDLGLALAGFEHRWLCEVDEYRRAILELRFPRATVYPDVRALGGPGLERVDLIAGGFPCKGVSVAGRRAGFGHPETALWREQLRIIRELRPRYALVENVAALIAQRPPGGAAGDLFREVVGGLAESGFDLEWDCIPASAVGAPHRRDRVFIVATSDAAGSGPSRPARQLVRGPSSGSSGCGDGSAPDTGRARREKLDCATGGGCEASATARERRCASASDTTSGRRRSPRSGSAREGGGARSVHRDDQAATDAEREPYGGARPGDVPRAQRAREEEGQGGQRGDWGDYAGAVEHWSEIVGWAAPQPVVRRMDDGGPAGLVRSRLSALGDGVLVQVGYFVGLRILEHAERTR